MHINNERLTDSLTHDELLHIESCIECEIERQKLVVLKQSANKMDLIQPPVMAWTNIKSRQTVNNKKVGKFKHFIYATAASVFCISIAWLMWSNYSLQQQLQRVLLVNQSLESQLVQESIPTFQQTQLLSKIHLIDLKLMKAMTTEEKLLILNERQQLMAEMVNYSQGNDYDYSI